MPPCPPLNPSPPKSPLVPRLNPKGLSNIWNRETSQHMPPFPPLNPSPPKCPLVPRLNPKGLSNIWNRETSQHMPPCSPPNPSPPKSPLVPRLNPKGLSNIFRLLLFRGECDPFWFRGECDPLLGANVTPVPWGVWRFPFARLDSLPGGCDRGVVWLCLKMKHPLKLHSWWSFSLFFRARNWGLILNCYPFFRYILESLEPDQSQPREKTWFHPSKSQVEAVPNTELLVLGSSESGRPSSMYPDGYWINMNQAINMEGFNVIICYLNPRAMKPYETNGFSQG